MSNIGRLRRRLAHLLVGPFIQFPETGSWMVHYDADHELFVAIRVEQWSGELTTSLPSFDDVESRTLTDYTVPTTHGTFSGTFA